MKQSISLLVTAPKDYAHRFLDAIEECNREGKVAFSPISIPMIETVIQQRVLAWSTFLGEINSYDYVVFTSRKAIDSMSLTLQHERVSLPQQVGYLAIGKYIECMKNRLQVTPRFIPKEPSPMGIVTELKESNIHSHVRIAVLGPQVEGLKEPETVPAFLRELKAIGCEVAFIPAYLTRSASPQACDQVKDLLRRHAIRGIALTSGAEAEVLRKVIDSLDVSTKPLENMVIASMGPYTARCAQQVGLPITFTSPQFGSFLAYARALQGYFLSLNTIST